MTDSTRAKLSARRRSFEARNLPYLGRVFGSAQLLLNDPGEAADLVADTYASAYRNWDSGRAEYLLLRDLCRIMIGFYYSDRSPATDSGEDVQPVVAGGAEFERKAAPTGPVRDASGVSAEATRSAVGNLPEDIRPAAVMYYAARFSSLEVAEIVGRQREFTRSMIRRSRKLLQESLLGGAGGGACPGISA